MRCWRMRCWDIWRCGWHIGKRSNSRVEILVPEDWPEEEMRWDQFPMKITTYFWDAEYTAMFTMDSETRERSLEVSYWEWGTEKMAKQLESMLSKWARRGEDRTDRHESLIWKIHNTKLQQIYYNEEMEETIIPDENLNETVTYVLNNPQKDLTDNWWFIGWSGNRDETTFIIYDAAWRQFDEEEHYPIYSRMTDYYGFKDKDYKMIPEREFEFYVDWAENILLPSKYYEKVLNSKFGFIEIEKVKITLSNYQWAIECPCEVSVWKQFQCNWRIYPQCATNQNITFTISDETKGRIDEIWNDGRMGSMLVRVTPLQAWPLDVTFVTSTLDTTAEITILSR